MKQLLLYSGGMDSIMSAYKHSDAHLIYVDYKGKYCKKEAKYIQEAASTIGRSVTVIDKRLNLAGLESGEGAFLPNRNAFLILTAINCYANLEFAPEEHVQIILNATASGIHPDKDEEFAERLVGLLNHMNRGGKDSPSREYSISLASRHLTKPESVAEYIANGGPVEGLLKSVSCYDKRHRQCGKCRSCVRKYISLLLNNIECDFTPPKKVLKDIRKRCKEGTWCSNKTEEQQTLEALKKVLI